MATTTKGAMKYPKKIIFHCLDTPDQGDTYGFKQVDRWHQELGWRDPVSGIACGYHYIIRRSGMVECGRPESSFGAHCRGHNDSIGIAYAGRKKMTQMQIAALITLYGKIYIRHKLLPEDFLGHYELNSSKDCPGQDMQVIRELLRFRRPALRLVESPINIV